MCKEPKGEVLSITPVKNIHDPRVKRTRKLLKQALGSLLSEKSFEATSVRDIAERATVNRVTFYAHYKDKYDLASSLIREQFQQRLSDSLPTTSSVTKSTLQKLCVTVFNFLAETYGRCNLARQFGPLLEGAMHEALFEFIVDWLRKNTPQARQTVLDTTAFALSSAFIGPGLRWARDGCPQPAGDMAEQLASIMVPGVLSALQGAEKEWPVGSYDRQNSDV